MKSILIIYVQFVILFAAFCCRADGQIAFTKNTENGKIVVYMKESVEPRGGKNVVRSGNRVDGVGGMHDIIHYTGYLEQDGTNRLFWKKTIAKLQIPEIPHEWNHVRIFDVEIKNESAAILYSDDDVFLDLTNAGAAGWQTNSIMVWDQMGMQDLLVGRVVWLDKVYVVGEISSNTPASRSPIFIRVDSSKATRLFPSALGKP